MSSAKTFSRLNVLTLRPILAAWRRSRNRGRSPGQIAAKQVWVGTVEVPDEATAIEKADIALDNCQFLVLLLPWMGRIGE
jgi:hypothetical protein